MNCAPLSEMILGGVSEGEIREWVGHADSKMVEHYRHAGRTTPHPPHSRTGQVNFPDLDVNEQECADQER